MDILAFAAVVAAFLIYNEIKDRRHAEQVAELCQRIQAPELAVAEHAGRDLEASPPAVSMFDDADWFRAQQARLDAAIDKAVA